MKRPPNKQLLQTRIIIILFVVFIATVLFIPSIINRKPQIQTKLLITALGLDRTQDGNISLSAIAVMPQGGQQAMVKSITVESEEKSIGECLETISEIYGKETELGLCGLVVLGQSTENASIMQELEFLFSSAFISPGTYLVNTSNSTAKDIITLASELDKSSAQILSSIVDFNANSCNISTVTLLEFVSQHYTPSLSSIIPTIEVDKLEHTKNESSDKSGETQEQNGEQQNGDKASKKTPIKSLKKTGIYKNGIKKGEFNSEQTLGYNLTKSDNMQGVIAIDNIVINGKEQGNITCSVYSKNCKKKAYFKDGKPVICYDVSVTLQIIAQNKIIKQWEKNGRNSDEVINPVISAFEEKIKDAVKSAILKTKDLDCDSFLIENEFYRFCNKEYKEYKKGKENFLQDVEIEVNTKVTFK